MFGGCFRGHIAFCRCHVTYINLLLDATIYSAQNAFLQHVYINHCSQAASLVLPENILPSTLPLPVNAAKKIIAARRECLLGVQKNNSLLDFSISHLDIRILHHDFSVSHHDILISHLDFSISHLESRQKETHLRYFVASKVQ